MLADFRAQSHAPKRYRTPTHTYTHLHTTDNMLTLAPEGQHWLSPAEPQCMLGEAGEFIV